MSKSLARFEEKAISFVVKFILVVSSLMVVLFPVWTYLIAKHFLSPAGFWQNILLLGVSFWFLGSLQVVFLILWVIFAVQICLMD